MLLGSPATRHISRSGAHCAANETSVQKMNYGQTVKQINDFAVRHRLTVQRDWADGTEIIPGRQGHIYEFDDTALGAVFNPTGEPRTRFWRALRDKCHAAGMKLLQDGDSEGAFSFDPQDSTQARLAIKVVGVQARRNTSPAQMMNLARGNRFHSELRTTTQASSAV